MDKAVQDTLAREHMALVDDMVASTRRRCGPGLDMDEVRSFALEGLADAISRFEPSRNVPFRAFAAQRIKGAIYDGFAKSSWFPRRLQRQITFFRRAEGLLHHHAMDPEPKDSVEAVHRLADTLKELAAAYVTTYVAEGEDNEPASSPAEAEDALERKRYCRLVGNTIDTLPEKQRMLIRHYFFDEMTLSDIADRFGHDKSWISRLLKIALLNLRNAFERQSISLETFESLNE